MPVPVPVDATLPHTAGAANALRTSLILGILVGPVYLVVGIAQGLLRPGFSFARHPLSLLSNGDFGWIQTVNFAVTGQAVVAAALAVARVAGHPGRPTAWALGAFGAGVALAAVFPADPVDGFPPGTPLGPPTSVSTPGLLHFLVSAVAFTCFGASALLASRMLGRRGERGMSRVSLTCGLVMLLGFFGGFALPSPVVGIWISVATGWGWLSATSRHLLSSVHPTGNGDR